MAELEDRLQQDKAMRDAARRLVEADLGFVRGDVQERGVGKRAADGAARVSRSFAEQTLDFVKAHPLAIGGGIVALLLILFRNPILDLALGLLGEDDDEPPPPEPPEPPAQPDRSENS